MWAKSKTTEAAENRQIGGSFRKPTMYGAADKLMAKAREALGLDQCVMFVTGAAPLKLETQQFFAALGINICEAYGMSENTGSTTFSSDESFKWATCGCPMPGVEVKIFRVDEVNPSIKKECPRAEDPQNATEEEQGEVCFRGPHIMMGYLCNPKLGQEHVDQIIKKNKEAIDDEGWLHSGDKGCKDKLGFLKITGRYKELIITAGGENIAPVPIEDNIKKLVSGISNVVMIGDKRKFNVVVITLQAGGTGELPGGEDLEGCALDVNPSTKTVPQAMKDPKWIEVITEAITATNANGRCCPSNAAKVQKFSILPLDFSVQTGEVTATLKLKRGAVTDKYGEFIDKMYDSKDVYVPYEP
jgi:long-chain-fatty-acid--CoA ligase ACSBG